MLVRPKLLVIEDEKIIRRFIFNTFTENNWQVLESSSVKEGLYFAINEKPEIIILDLGLPDDDGMTVVQELRAQSDIPIIVVSGRSTEVDKITALEAGADDYIVKPFSVGELVARVNLARERRLRYLKSNAAVSNIFSFSDVIVDLSNRRVTKNEKSVHLSNTEYRLLVYLINNAGKVLTHSQMLNTIWGGDTEKNIEYLRVYMRSLRQKLEKNPTQPVNFLTESGVGYVLVV
jgi:two-component system KDP operon response regulator KdpE